MRIDTRKLAQLIKSQGLTKSGLAEDAGVSRQALHGILNKERAEVREETIKRLVRALRIPDASLLQEDPLTGYKSQLAEEHIHFTFRGLGLPATEWRLFEDLFVPVRVRAVPMSKKDLECGSTLFDFVEEKENDQIPVRDDPVAFTLAECLALHRRLLLRGDPGGGKTTSLRHIAHSYARGNQSLDGYPDGALTPILVHLAEYAAARERDANLGLARFVLDRVQPGASIEAAGVIDRLLEEQLRVGNCLVLLDGLDEIGRDTRLAHELRHFILDYPDNQFVLTSRVVGLDSRPWENLDFNSYDVVGWSEVEIRLFARRWYTSLCHGNKRKLKQAELQANELCDAILAQPALKEIAANPLMLTILAALHHANAALPRRRVDLYAKIIEVLLETWEAERRSARPGDSLHGITLERREFEWLLSRMALAMQRRDHVLNPRWWVAEFVQEFLRDTLAMTGEEEAKDQADRVIRHLCERSGLLVERGANVFGFSHRSFHEFFAARGILDEAEAAGSDPVSLLRPYLYHPRWEQVVRLAAAQLGPVQATALIRTILDDPDPAGRFLRRGLRLVLRCLIDGAAIADRQLLNHIFSMETILGNPQSWNMDVFILLSELKTSRYAIDAKRAFDQMNAVNVSSDGNARIREVSFWDPVTEKRLWQAECGGHVSKPKSSEGKTTLANFDEWFQGVADTICNPATSESYRTFKILRLRHFKHERICDLLQDRLEGDDSPRVREWCARGLRPYAGKRPDAAESLLKRLNTDKSDNVCSACASSLVDVAPIRSDVSNCLKALLESPNEQIRLGAVQGLARAAQGDWTLFASLLRKACDKSEAYGVRVNCLGAIDQSRSVSNDVEKCFLDCLHDTSAPDVQQFVAEILARALAEDRWPWSQELVATIEAKIMADPDWFDFSALEQLVNAREIRGGPRFEQYLNDALAPFNDRIVLAFVFGSVARRQQNDNSDIDLMIVGDVRLQELALALHEAEQTLGRPVNPILFSSDKFRDQYREGNPLLLDVVRKEKIFLKGNRDELTELVADRSPE